TFLDKIGLSENFLKCGIHEPLSKSRQKNMIQKCENPTAIHNNCSGKHSMMLALCVLNGWDIYTYDDINHPLQKVIKEKIYQLCEVNSTYPITKDGCGVPIFSMPLYNMLKGYFNLLFDEKYSRLTKAILNQPYIFGGENRTDTKIIQMSSKNIICKTGACGLFITVDLEHKDGFVVKISDSNMSAREVVVIDFLKYLNRVIIPYDYSIKTIHNDVVGKIQTKF
ncbi:asparaginase, partial [bacterium]|nr:asparaginase [bacterium]